MVSLIKPEGMSASRANSVMVKQLRSIFRPPKRFAQRKAGSSRRGTRARGGTVLLVEDNPDVAEASAGLLEQLGYRMQSLTMQRLRC